MTSLTDAAGAARVLFVTPKGLYLSTALAAHRVRAAAEPTVKHATMLSENGSTSKRPAKRAAAATTPSPSQPAAVKEVWGTLVLQMNADDTQTFELKEDKAHIVGRASNVDIRADLPHVSAAHMTIREAGVSQSGGIVVRVMDISSNGTCLNDVPVGRNMERELRDGDVITFTKLSSKSDSATEYPRLLFRAAPNAAPNGRNAERSKRSR